MSSEHVARIVTKCCYPNMYRITLTHLKRKNVSTPYAVKRTTDAFLLVENCITSKTLSVKQTQTSS